MTAAQDFAALQKLTPTEALAYLQRRNKTTETYGWQDLWQQEHASQFTISRLTQADLLQSLQDQITKSVNGELSRRDFLRDAKKALADAGWWGEKDVVDPSTGKILKTTFDPARLKLIFDTNTSMAYAAGQWQRIERTKRSHPYVRYISLADDKVRPAHRAWNNVTLPVDDAFWRTHFPPNGWRCRCRAVAVSQSDYDRGYSLARPGAENDQYDKNGKPLVIAPTIRVPMKKQAPDVQMHDWLDKRSGQVRSIPVGIDPGFGYNPGMARASAQAAMVKDKIASLSPPLAAAAEKSGLILPATAKASLQSLVDAKLAKISSFDTPKVMETGLSEKQYLSAFESAVGGYRTLDIVGASTHIDDALFRESDGTLKLFKRGREIYVEHIASTITAPDDIYEVREELRKIPGQFRIVRRLLKTFGEGDSAIHTIVVFTRDGTAFKGTSAFVPINGKGDVDVAYFEKQRIGVKLK